MGSCLRIHQTDALNPVSSSSDVKEGSLRLVLFGVFILNNSCLLCLWKVPVGILLSDVVFVCSPALYLQRISLRHDLKDVTLAAWTPYTDLTAVAGQILMNLKGQTWKCSNDFKESLCNQILDLNSKTSFQCLDELFWVYDNNTCKIKTNLLLAGSSRAPYHTFFNPGRLMLNVHLSRLF